MKEWLEANSKSIQALGAIVTMLAAVFALIGVKVQIDASARQAREQSARDIYREFLNLSISRPDLADPDLCKIKDDGGTLAYENYLEYALYTAEQLHDASPTWSITFLRTASRYVQKVIGPTIARACRLSLRTSGQNNVRKRLLTHAGHRAKPRPRNRYIMR